MGKYLTEWRCDVCDQTIHDAKDGYVVWSTDAKHRAYDFKIIHQGKCDHGEQHSSAALRDFFSEDGLAYLLSFLSIGPIMISNGQRQDSAGVVDMHEFVDFVRRVQTPCYEEARVHFKKHDLHRDYSDSNEVAPYMQDGLKGIVDRY